MGTNQNFQAAAVWQNLDPDIGLMLAVRSGETAAFSKLLEKHYSGVRRFCYRKVHDAAAAEDLAQEVFLRVYRYRTRYEPAAKFSTWIYRIAANLALNWIRDRGRDWSYACAPEESPAPDLPDCRPRVDERLLLDANAAELWRAVDELPDRQRAAVLLRNVDELAGEEIAEKLGCSHQAVRSMLCRAYSTLRVTLGAELGGNRRRDVSGVQFSARLG